MNRNIIFQNLEDAGCNLLIIEDFSNFMLLTIIKKLLNNLHKAQKQIDCLDFLIFSLKQKNT